MNSDGEWVEIGGADDIPKQGARTVLTAAGTIGLFRTADGEVFAIDNACPHLAGPLTQGIVHGRKVTCPLHNLVINLTTGQADGPDGGCVATYPVKQEGGRLFLDVSSLRRKRVA